MLLKLEVGIFNDRVFFLFLALMEDINYLLLLFLRNRKNVVGIWNNQHIAINKSSINITRIDLFNNASELMYNKL